MAKDEEGHFVMAQKVWMEGEAVGFLQTLHWLHDLDILLAVIVTDCKGIVDHLYNNRSYIIEVGSFRSAEMFFPFFRTFKSSLLGGKFTAEGHIYKLFTN